MNWRGSTLWGFVGTVVLTSLMSGSQGLGLTRMSLPYMLGTMFTPDRDRAKLVGFLVHLVNGWLFALIYAAAFESWRRATWWLGALIGLVHGLFVLTGRHVDAAGAAPAHGQRAARPHADAAARAARLPGAQLRPPNADLGGAGAPGLRRDPRRVLPFALGPRATPAGKGTGS